MPTKEYVFEKIRYCPDCKENVHLVKSDSDLSIAIEFNYCVSIPIEITRTNNIVIRQETGVIRMKDEK